MKFDTAWCKECKSEVRIERGIGGLTLDCVICGSALLLTGDARITIPKNWIIASTTQSRVAHQPDLCLRLDR